MEAKGAAAEAAADMEDPSCEGLLEVGGDAEADGATGGQGAEEMIPSHCGSGEGEAAMPRKQLPGNIRKELRTPKVSPVS